MSLRLSSHEIAAAVREALARLPDERLVDLLGPVVLRGLGLADPAPPAPSSPLATALVQDVAPPDLDLATALAEIRALHTSLAARVRDLWILLPERIAALPSQQAGVSLLWGLVQELSPHARPAENFDAIKLLGGFGSVLLAAPAAALGQANDQLREIAIAARTASPLDWLSLWSRACLLWACRRVAQRFASEPVQQRRTVWEEIERNLKGRLRLIGGAIGDVIWDARIDAPAFSFPDARRRVHEPRLDDAADPDLPLLLLSSAPCNPPGFPSIPPLALNCRCMPVVPRKHRRTRLPACARRARARFAAEMRRALARAQRFLLRGVTPSVGLARARRVRIEAREGRWVAVIDGRVIQIFGRVKGQR